jgi:hypothetical protein
MRRTVLLVVVTLGLGVMAPPYAATQTTAPDRRDIVREVSAADPARFACAHVEGRACKLDWINAVASALHAIDPRWGLNMKRDDDRQGLSMDVVTFRLGPTDRHVEAFDICGGCGGGAPTVVWQNITNYATIGQPGTARWVKPSAPTTGGGGGGGGGTGGGVTPTPTVNLQPVLDALAALATKVDAVAALALAARDGALDAKAEAEQAKVNASDVRHLAVPELKALIESAGLSGCMVGRVPKAFGGSAEVRFCPEVPR